ncbi:hypothetical protein PV10_01257 [Exophiala mesophila]|uniref:Protein Asterix n=1 Tax=Exophiala mesophila TaxID=212818 RepID=A0A0D1X6S1_EXOME|nr:uncharacterized protein PV10_01257 [Exophiala mesophila]KIV97510.1 hypothetical protein PV10_01257 [Exophiala mesophila]
MASKKDQRRPDLVIPYVEPKESDVTDFGTTISSTMPMAAMFTRNRMLGWFALLQSLLTWLGETPAQKRNATTPGYLSFGMAVLAVIVTYMPLFLPPTPNPRAATGTGVPAAAPQNLG